jgi:hypothetical protein
MSAERAKRLSRANPMDKMVASSGDLVGSPSISEKNPGQLNSFTIQLADETWLHVFSHLSQQDLCQGGLPWSALGSIGWLWIPDCGKRKSCNCFASEMKSNLHMSNLI